MSLLKRIKQRSTARKFRVRNKLDRVNGKKFKVVVFRSNRHIYASLFDVETSLSVFTYSSLNVCADKKDKSCNSKDVAREVGEAFGKMCLQHGVESLALDRGSYLYHGKVVALADGIRSIGIQL